MLPTGNNYEFHPISLREQATEIGKAMQALRIPIGTVTTSPFCRTKDTTELAFGQFTVSNDLYFAIGTEASETKRITESLRRMLSTPRNNRACSGC